MPKSQTARRNPKRGLKHLKWWHLPIPPRGMNQPFDWWGVGDDILIIFLGTNSQNPSYPLASSSSLPLPFLMIPKATLYNVPIKEAVTISGVSCGLLGLYLKVKRWKGCQTPVVVDANNSAPQPAAIDITLGSAFLPLTSESAHTNAHAPRLCWKSKKLCQFLRVL